MRLSSLSKTEYLERTPIPNPRPELLVMGLLAWYRNVSGIHCSFFLLRKQ